MNDNAINLVVVSDIHAGSNSALCVPDMKLAGGGTYQYTDAQKALYDAWSGLCKEWAAPDILIVNGDAIEGQARKESGVPCWSTNLSDQLNCAKKLVKMWHAKKIYIIDGTGYHVDAAGTPLENMLAKNLEAEKIGPGTSISHDELFLNVGGFTFHFSHHIQVGTGWYRTTPIARELVFALLNESHKYKVDVIVRSHVHSFCGVEFTRQKGFTTPCWQLQTRYMKKKSALGMVPDIGAIRFRIYPGEIRTDKRFYKASEFKPKLFKYEA
jgi:hypothetical protein